MSDYHSASNWDSLLENFAAEVANTAYDATLVRMEVGESAWLLLQGV